MFKPSLGRTTDSDKGGVLKYLGQNTDRKQLLHKRQNRNRIDSVQQQSFSNKIKAMIKRSWRIVQSDPALSHIFSDKPWFKLEQLKQKVRGDSTESVFFFYDIWLNILLISDRIWNQKLERRGKEQSTTNVACSRINQQTQCCIPQWNISLYLVTIAMCDFWLCLLKIFTRSMSFQTTMFCPFCGSN